LYAVHMRDCFLFEMRIVVIEDIIDASVPKERIMYAYQYILLGP